MAATIRRAIADARICLPIRQITTIPRLGGNGEAPTGVDVDWSIVKEHDFGRFVQYYALPTIRSLLINSIQSSFRTEVFSFLHADWQQGKGVRNDIQQTGYFWMTTEKVNQEHIYHNYLHPNSLMTSGEPFFNITLT